jgi:trypsin
MIKRRAVQVLTAMCALMLTLMAAPPAGAVVGGTTAAQGQFPYVVSIVVQSTFGSSHNCGGSILNATTILTAAHCADGPAARSLSIRYGSANVTAGTMVAVRQVIMNPQWNRNTISHDVAILKLASPMTLDGTRAAVIALAQAGSEPSGTAQVAGWGRLSGGGSLPVQQQYASLPIVGRAACQARWDQVNNIDASMMCAGGSGASACNGDSGGPLVQDQGGRPVEVGIVSWGHSRCPASSYPGVFASVASLRSWIDANLGTSTRPAVLRLALAVPAPPVGSDHGCPFDSVCLYSTAGDYQESQPAIIDDQALYNDGGPMSIATVGYAEVVNNTGFAPEYSSEGAIVADLLGGCLYLPEDTEAPRTDTPVRAILPGVNAIVVSPTRHGADSLVVPCPTS